MEKKLGPSKRSGADKSMKKKKGHKASEERRKKGENCLGGKEEPH